MENPTERIKQLELTVEQLLAIKNPVGATDEELKKLSEPTRSDEIEWRVQSCGENKDGVWARIVPYIDARAVIDRLDKYVGPSRWQDGYRETKNGFVCGLSIFTSNSWITKEDASDLTDIEPTKGGVSGALKRAAVKWGIGRDLYSMPPQYAETSLNKVQGWEYGKTKKGTEFYWRLKQKADVQPSQIKSSNPKLPTKPEIPSSEKYAITFGKYSGQLLDDIEYFELQNYVAYIRRDAKAKGKEITGVVKDFLERAEKRLGNE